MPSEVSFLYISRTIHVRIKKACLRLDKIDLFFVCEVSIDYLGVMSSKGKRRDPPILQESLDKDRFVGRSHFCSTLEDFRLSFYVLASDAGEPPKGIDNLVAQFGIVRECV